MKVIFLVFIGLILSSHISSSQGISGKYNTTHANNKKVNKKLSDINLYIENNFKTKDNLIDYISVKSDSIGKYIKFYQKNITNSDLEEIAWLYVSQKFIKSKEHTFVVQTIEKSLKNISAFWMKQRNIATKKLLLRKLIKKIDIPINDKKVILNAISTVPNDKLNKFYESITWFIQKLEFKDFLEKIRGYKKYLNSKKTGTG